MSIHELVAAVIWNNEASLKIIAGMMDKPQWESGTTPRLRFWVTTYSLIKEMSFHVLVLGK